MIDARAEHERLLTSVDALLEKTASRINQHKAATAKPSDKTAQLTERVDAMQIEANLHKQELSSIMVKKAALREQKIAEARHVTRVAFRLLAA